jgi:hypothetical protein
MSATLETIPAGRMSCETCSATTTVNREKVAMTDTVAALDCPPFDFPMSSEDDGVEPPHTSLRLTYPEHLGRWQPLYKWILAIPHDVVFAPSH